MIAEWWTSLSVIMKVLWGITLAASLIFVIQTVMTFIGADAGGDFDADAGGGLDVNMDDAASAMGTGMNLLTFRNLINFLLGYGWAGVLLDETIASPLLLQIVAIVVGLLFVLAFVFMLSQVMKLSHDGSFRLSESVGLTADVYLRIPAARSGRGKVQVSVKGSVHEIDAITDNDAEIPTGGQVKILEVAGDDVVVVK